MLRLYLPLNTESRRKKNYLTRVIVSIRPYAPLRSAALRPGQDGKSLLRLIYFLPSSLASRLGGSHSAIHASGIQREPSRPSSSPSYLERKWIHTDLSHPNSPPTLRNPPTFPADLKVLISPANPHSPPLEASTHSSSNSPDSEEHSVVSMAVEEAAAVVVE